ncbi:BACON domain-containing protein [Bacteroides sp. 224]|uniref:BACON domain-containing protein n=1 Tax=Bacteroides sp. 224 TaxID=2302936 RepID=UPI0013D55E91|nr:BACON domain-containing protein [Bacteroides sp. 224]NDV66573.1 hypothetical protein [Bacteroides sp. 224]
MNKNTTILTPILIALISLFLFNSCSIEQELDTTHTGTAEIVFTAELPASTIITTRGTAGSLDENRVRQLDLLVFAKDGNLKEIIQVTPTYKDTDKVVEFRTTLEAGNYDFMLVANARASIEAASLVVDDTTQADAAAALVFTQSGKFTLSDTDSGVIPMWASLKNVNVTVESNGTGTADKKKFPDDDTPESTGLTRIYAKINVSVASSVPTSTFELTKVSFYNYNTQGRIVPESDKYPFANTNSEPPSFSELPSLPGSPTPVNNTGASGSISVVTNGVTDTNKCENQIYVLEAATQGDYGTSNWVKNPCLIIGGKYGGTDSPVTYYRIDFIEKNKADGTEKWLNILRNHIYQVTITGVTEKGYDDEEKALNSAPINMTAQVMPWDEGNHANVSIDGPDYLGVTPSSLEFEDTDGGVQKTFTLKTNKNWTAKLTQDGGTYFSIISGDYSGTATEGKVFTIKALSNNTSTNTVRTGAITFTAGRMKVKVQIKQAVKPVITAKIYLYKWDEKTGRPAVGATITNYVQYPDKNVFTSFYALKTKFVGFPNDGRTGVGHLHFNNVKSPNHTILKYRIDLTIENATKAWTVEATGKAAGKLNFTEVNKTLGGGTIWVNASGGGSKWYDGTITIKSGSATPITFTAHQIGIISELRNKAVTYRADYLNSKIFYYDIMVMNGINWLDRNLGAEDNGFFSNYTTGVAGTFNEVNRGAFFESSKDANDACPPGCRLSISGTKNGGYVTSGNEMHYLLNEATFTGTAGKQLTTWDGKTAHYKNTWYVPTVKNSGTTKVFLIPMAGFGTVAGPGKKEKNMAYFWAQGGFTSFNINAGTSGYTKGFYNSTSGIYIGTRCVRE